MGIKFQKEYGKSRCDVKQFLRPRCKIAVKKDIYDFDFQFFHNYALSLRPEGFKV